MPDRKPKKERSWIVEQAVICAVMAPLSLAAYFYWRQLAFLPGSSFSGKVVLLLMWASMILGMAQILALVPATVLGVRSARRGNFKGVARWSPTVLTIVVFSVVVPLQMDPSIDGGVERLIANGKPVAADIEAYLSEHGRYPVSLQEVYGDSPVPTTGSRAYDSWEYEPMEELVDGYELRVATPKGWANWDVLVYRPSHNYPEEMYGGTVQRYGDWAYVNE